MKLRFICRHRFADDHECLRPSHPLEQSMNGSYSLVLHLLTTLLAGDRKSLSEKKKRPARVLSSKGETRAAKVRLMRLKGRAKGDTSVSSSSRFYMSVTLPRSVVLRVVMNNHKAYDTR
jgi:hypothetical protein